MIEAEGICKAYGKKTVLDQVHLRANKGDCIGIVGGNGCGKTTLLSILSGVQKIKKGSIRFQGEEAVGHPSVFETYISYVPQENPVIDELSVKDNLRLWHRGNRQSLEEDLKQGAAASLGLGSVMSVQAGKLSGGMKKRLSIAGALANQGDVLILDEPGAALDLICKEEIKRYLNDFRAHGGTIIMASHEMEELSLCNHMYILKSGMLKKISTGLSTQELINQFI